MPFYRIATSKDQRPSILHLHLAECTAETIFKQLEIPLRTVYNNVNRYKATGTMEDKPKNGRPKSTTTKEIVKIIREKIRRHPRRNFCSICRKDCHQPPSTSLL
ncbi:hypothetical protein V3C99_004630 [Haemonchus contortus]